MFVHSITKLVCFSFIAVFMSPAFAADETPKAGGEQSFLEGTWIVTELERNGGQKAPKHIIDGMKIVIEGKKFTMVFNRGGQVNTIVCSHKIDKTKTPMQLDFTPTEEKDKGKGTITAIFERKGDVLKICGVDKTKGEPRPSEFKTKSGTSLRLMVLKLKK